MTKATILLLNDNPKFCRFLNLILEVAGYNILPANGTQEALQWLREQPVHLIILANLSWPNLAGYQLLHQVSQHPNWNTIPVICIAEPSLTWEMNVIQQFDIDRCLTKPIQTSELLSAVHYNILPV